MLLVVAGGFAYAGKRLRAPLGVRQPGGAAGGFMIAIWLLANYTVGVAMFVYGLQVSRLIRASPRPACVSARSSMRR